MAYAHHHLVTGAQLRRQSDRRMVEGLSVVVIVFFFEKEGKNWGGCERASVP